MRVRSRTGSHEFKEVKGQGSLRQWVGKNTPPGDCFWLILQPGDEKVKNCLERASLCRIKEKPVKRAKICIGKQ